jgi:hypothetical protein
VAHQPLDSFVVHGVTEADTQLRSDPPGAVGAVAALVDRDDEIPEFGIGEHPGRRVGFGVPPRVERRPGHPHRPATGIDRQIGAPVNDEGVDHFGRTFSRAK